MVFKDGSETEFLPGSELKGDVRDRLSPGDRNHTTNYGKGAAFSWITSYLEYIYENAQYENVSHIEAAVIYEINRNGVYEEKLIQYP